MSITDRFSEPTLFILISLADGNKHGYAIMEDIERSYDIKLGPGTLYGAISRMEKSKLIRAIPSQDRKKPYQITFQRSIVSVIRLISAASCPFHSQSNTSPRLQKS